MLIEPPNGRGRGRVSPLPPPHRSRRALLTHRAPVEGRTRSAIGAWAAHAAPIRGRAASVTCQFRLCVRDMRCDAPFLRCDRLPSTVSAADVTRALFEASSDLCPRPTPHAFPPGFAPSSFPDWPGTTVAAAGGMRPPRFRTKDVSTCMGSPTAQGPSHTRLRTHGTMLPSLQRNEISTSEKPVSQLNTQPMGLAARAALG